LPLFFDIAIFLPPPTLLITLRFFAVLRRRRCFDAVTMLRHTDYAAAFSRYIFIFSFFIDDISNTE